MMSNAATTIWDRIARVADLAAPSAHHVFDTGQGVAALLACTVETNHHGRCSRLQHVKCFSAAHLAHDDPVRTHAERHSTPDLACHLPRSFDAGAGSPG